jgi:hypothetical protein
MLENASDGEQEKFRRAWEIFSGLAPLLASLEPRWGNFKIQSSKFRE